jgi:hypothetical protein
MDFTGQSLPLSSQGIAAATAALSVSPVEVWTVMAVETAGCGFLPDRRPQILYERHIFSRLTSGRFDDGDISDPSAGGYGPSGPHQYDRLARAIALDRSAALRAASWGLAQVLGINCTMAGFADVETMVAAVVRSEDAHLFALANYVKAAGLKSALQSHNWTVFARGYNGKTFAVNQYDTKLAQAFTRFSAGPLPDLDIRAAQLYLTFRGLKPGAVDGVMGAKTRTALAQFAGPGVTAVTPEILARLAS